MFEVYSTPSSPIGNFNGNEGEHISDPNLVPILNIAYMRRARNILCLGDSHLCAHEGERSRVLGITGGISEVLDL
jgi:hypothetical protein